MLGTKSCPRVNIGISGVSPATSPKSYSNRPAVNVGAAVISCSMSAAE